MAWSGYSWIHPIILLSKQFPHYKVEKSQRLSLCNLMVGIKGVLSAVPGSMHSIQLLFLFVNTSRMVN